MCVCNFLWMQLWTSSSGKGWLFLPPPTQVTVPLRPVRPPTPFSHLHGEYFSSLSICMKTHASLWSRVSWVWHYIMDVIPSRAPITADPATCVHTYFLLHPMISKCGTHYLTDYLHCCPKTSKNTSMSDTVALGDMFLHYHEHTLYFDSIPHIPSCFQILTRAPDVD